MNKHVRRIPVREAAPSEPEAAGSAPVEPSPAADSTDWRDRALRLQAEMDNFRKRQERRAEQRIAEEQARLLREFLPVVDNLEAALAHIPREDALYQGVRSTYEGMLHLLQREKVEPIAALGAAFDPLLHEAVGVVPAPPDQGPFMVVAAEQQRGYRSGDGQLLRPARVIVASKAEVA